MRVEQIGDCTLYLGDCLDVLPTLGPVDAVVTDPPYGVEFAEWDGQFPSVEVWRALHLTCRRGANVVVIPGEQSLPDKLAVLSGVFEYQWVISWYKPNAMQFGKTGFSKHNLVWWLSNGKPTNRPEMIDVIVAPMGAAEDAKIGHPSPKPLAVMATLVRQFVSLEQVVIDPFMGSGTTLVACAKLGRRGIGIEIDPGYFDIACKRVEEAYRQPDMFVDRPAPPVQETMF